MARYYDDCHCVSCTAARLRESVPDGPVSESSRGVAVVVLTVVIAAALISAVYQSFGGR